MLYVESKRKKESTLKKKYPKAHIIDVTSNAEDDFVKLSPFYPHGGVPIPFSESAESCSVEGIWQGLKVFRSYDVDPSLFRNATMKNLKRTIRRFGEPIGHRKGINGQVLLGYLEARIEIFLPSYKWVLENKAIDQISRIRHYLTKSDVLLLDYAVNDNVLDSGKPLSHAYLVKAFVEGNYPNSAELKSIIKDPVALKKHMEHRGNVKDMVDNSQLKMF